MLDEGFDIITGDLFNGSMAGVFEIAKEVSKIGIGIVDRGRLTHMPVRMAQVLLDEFFVRKGACPELLQDRVEPLTSIGKTEQQCP
jgi:hypothetical protein